MIEVELKFKLPADSLPALEEYLATIGTARHLQNADTYYDTSTFDLLRQAVFVRVRNQQRLEFKFNAQAAPAHIHCTERVFSLTPEPRQAEEMNHLFSGFLPHWQGENTVHTALHQNGLIELAHIENRRAEYTCGNLTLCLDQVDSLGIFLEIETLCEEGGELALAVSRVQAFAADIKAQQVHIGYVELWLQKYHPYAYRKGKYQEEYALDIHPAR
ncbi:MAG TPA: CYTH domain-containing protein [Ktedonobacteraceae bacterium]|nr:CYTH domain-containing protein [Ktedonobacteraceae bacterium]